MISIGRGRGKIIDYAGLLDKTQEIACMVAVYPPLISTSFEYLVISLYGTLKLMR